MAPMFQQHVPTSCLRWSWSLHGLEVDCSLCRSGTSKAAPESWSYFVCWQLWRKLALICLRPKNCCFSVCVCPVHSTSGFLFRKAYYVKFHLKSFEGIIESQLSQRWVDPLEVHPKLHKSLQRVVAQKVQLPSKKDELLGNFKLSVRGSIRKAPNVVSGPHFTSVVACHQIKHSCWGSTNAWF